MCQSHTGRLTGLWFLPKPAFGLNTNDDDDSCTCTCIIIFMYVIINYENPSHNNLQMIKKLKHKDLFKVLAQNKMQYSNIKSGYIQNSVIGMYRCFSL